MDSSGQVYVAGYSGYQSEVMVYASMAALVPTRTILTAESGSVVVDSSGSLYVMGANTVYVYAAGSNGTAVPTRTITSSATQLGTGYAADLHVDGAGNLYVATLNIAETTGSVLVFAPGANGNVTPTRTLTLNAVPFGLTVDASGTIYVSENNVTYGQPPAFIAVFQTGATAPSKTITISASASQIGGVQVDSVGNIYSLIETVSSYNTAVFSIFAVGPTSTGTINPTDELTATALNSPEAQIAIQ